MDLAIFLIFRRKDGESTTVGPRSQTSAWYQLIALYVSCCHQPWKTADYSVMLIAPAWSDSSKLVFKWICRILLRRGQKTYCNHHVIAQKWTKLLRYNQRIRFHVTGLIKWLFSSKKTTFIKYYYEGDTKLVKFTMTLNASLSFILKHIIVIFFLGTWYYVKLILINVLCCFGTF